MANPRCPKCGAPTVKRTSHKTGKPFYGCRNYPACQSYTPYVAPRKPADFTPSRYQQALFDELVQGQGNVILDAVAGSGKTFSCVQAMFRLIEAFAQHRIVFLAFNKAIAVEFSSKVPAGTQASTLHSICYSQVRRWNPNVQVDTNQSKIYTIIDEAIQDLPTYTQEQRTVRKTIRSALARAASLAKNTLTDAEDREALKAMCGRYNVELNGSFDEIADRLPKVLDACRQETNVIDFDDMLWFVHVHQIPCERFDWIFVDEAQDLNRLQMEILQRLRKGNTRTVAVGDPFQAIYGFRGAHVRAMEELPSPYGEGFFFMLEISNRRGRKERPCRTSA